MKIYHIFISHSWSHSKSYEDLINLLKSQSYFNFKDYSVPKDDPIHTNGTDKELEEAIRNKMKPCSVILILAGVYSTYSKWIKKEIKIAKELGKKIVAIEYWGSERTSQIVKENADKIVKWNGKSIVEVIKELSQYKNLF